MAVSESAALQAAVDIIGGDPDELMDAYYALLGNRTNYELINGHQESLLPVGHEAKIITRLMGESRYLSAHSVLKQVIHLMQAGSDGASTEVSHYN